MSYGATIHGRKYRNTSYFAGLSDLGVSVGPPASETIAGVLAVGMVLAGIVTGAELLKLDRQSQPARSRRRRYA